MNGDVPIQSSPQLGSQRTRPEMPADAFEIRRVALPLDGSKREAWKLSIVVLCLNFCRSNSATIEQLNVLSWAVRDASNAAEFRDAWQDKTNFQFLRAWDESLQRTVRLGISAGLTEWTKTSRVKLTENGLSLARKLLSQPEAFLTERAFLASFGNFSTSGMWSHLGEISTAQRSHVKDQK